MAVEGQQGFIRNPEIFGHWPCKPMLWSIDSIKGMCSATPPDSEETHKCKEVFLGMLGIIAFLPSVALFLFIGLPAKLIGLCCTNCKTPPQEEGKIDDVTEDPKEAAAQQKRRKRIAELKARKSPEEKSASKAKTSSKETPKPKKERTSKNKSVPKPKTSSKSKTVRSTDKKPTPSRRRGRRVRRSKATTRGTKRVASSTNPSRSTGTRKAKTVNNEEYNKKRKELKIREIERHINKKEFPQAEDLLNAPAINAFLEENESSFPRLKRAIENAQRKVNRTFYIVGKRFPYKMSEFMKVKETSNLLKEAHISRDLALIRDLLNNEHIVQLEAKISEHEIVEKIVQMGLTPLKRNPLLKLRFEIFLEREHLKFLEECEAFDPQFILQQEEKRTLLREITSEFQAKRIAGKLEEIQEIFDHNKELINEFSRCIPFKALMRVHPLLRQELPLVKDWYSFHRELKFLKILNKGEVKLEFIFSQRYALPVSRSIEVTIEGEEGPENRQFFESGHRFRILGDGNCLLSSFIVLMKLHEKDNELPQGVDNLREAAIDWMQENWQDLAHLELKNHLITGLDIYLDQKIKDTKAMFNNKIEAEAQKKNKKLKGLDEAVKVQKLKEAQTNYDEKVKKNKTKFRTREKLAHQIQDLEAKHALLLASKNDNCELILQIAKAERSQTIANALLSEASEQEMIEAMTQANQTLKEALGTIALDNPDADADAIEELINWYLDEISEPASFLSYETAYALSHMYKVPVEILYNQDGLLIDRGYRFNVNNAFAPRRILSIVFNGTDHFDVWIPDEVWNNHFEEDVRFTGIDPDANEDEPEKMDSPTFPKGKQHKRTQSCTLEKPVFSEEKQQRRKSLDFSAPVSIDFL